MCVYSLISANTSCGPNFTKAATAPSCQDLELPTPLRLTRERVANLWQTASPGAEALAELFVSGRFSQ